MFDSISGLSATSCIAMLTLTLPLLAKIENRNVSAQADFTCNARDEWVRGGSSPPREPRSSD
jgi:hypothetical protein